ncbi:MAG: O-antigen ligase family protein [Candidatus Ornithospirochaeta sp.]
MTADIEDKDSIMLETLAKVIISLYVVVGFFEKIHALLDTILFLDGIITAFAAAYIVYWFYKKRRTTMNTGTVSLFLMSFFILFSSMVGKTSFERLGVAVFAIVETWSLLLCFSVVKEDIREIFIAFSIFAIVFSFFYCLFGIAEGIELDQARVQGLSDQANSLGVMAGLSVLFCMLNIRKWENLALTVVWNMAIALLIPFFVYAMFMADSRTSFFALVFACLFIFVVAMLFLRGRSKVFWAVVPAVFVIISALVFILASSRSLNAFTFDSLTSGRTRIWSDTFAVMGLKEYVLGFSGNTENMIRMLEESGASGVAVSQSRKHLAHNMYFGMLFEYGIIPAVSFIVFWLWSMARGFRRLSKKKKWAMREVFSALTVLSFFLVHEIGESSVYFIGGAEQLVFIVSLSVLYGICTYGKADGGRNE